MTKPALLVKLAIGCVVAYLFMLGLSTVVAQAPGVGDVSANQGLHLIKSDEQSIVLELCTSGYEIEEVSTEDTSYHVLSVPGYAYNDQAGHPQLPLQGALLGIPYGAQVDLRVLEAEGDIISGTYNLYPVPRPIIAHDPSSGLPEDQGSELVPDQSVYSVNAFYPSELVRIASSGFIRDQRFLRLQLYPFQYHLMTQQLKFYQRLRVEISFSYPDGGLSATASGELGGPFESALRNSILNYESARAWRQTSGGASLLEAPDLGSCDDCYKMPIRDDGIYQLTYSDLETAGLPLDPPGVFIDPRSLHIYDGRGEEIAIYVHDEEFGRFDWDDYILFYGEEVNTKYTNTNVYWLTWGGDGGIRMLNRQGEGDKDTPVWFEATARVEQDNKYMTNLPPYPSADELERWYWEKLQPVGQQPVTGTYSINVRNIFAGEAYSATLRADLWGGSTDDNELTTDHHVLIYVNGYPVEDAWWDGIAPHPVVADFPSSALLEGENVIEVVCPGDTSIGALSVVVTDWFEITYRDTHVAEGDSLAFAQDDIGSGVWEYQISGFTQASIEVYDVTVPISVSRIVSRTIFPIESTWMLTFTQDIAAPTRYLALTGPETKSPLAITLDTPSNLRGPSNGADYLIITHSDFHTNVLALANHRAAQGFDTMVVDVQDIYDEFSHGILDPRAIRDFLTYAYSYWNPRPSYVLLVGDGNYDFKDNIGRAEPNYIPPYLACVDPFNGEIATDNRYACVSGTDNMPDLNIGRLPVKTPDEADAVIGKILAYEASPFADWKQQMQFIADNPQDEDDFRALSDYIADNHLPSGYAAEKVYYGVLPHTTPSAVTTAIIDGINEGRLLVNYFGHGYLYYWAVEKFLEESPFGRHDLALLTNDERLPLVVSMSCYMGRFDLPSSPTINTSCLSESLVRAEGKGAVATWASTGSGQSGGHRLLDSGFFTAVFSDGVVEVGAATTQAALGMDSYQYLVDQYVLFGDPAMKLAVQYDSFLPLAVKAY